MSRSLEAAIEWTRAEAARLRAYADTLPDQELAQLMREIADDVDGAANEAERSVDYTAYLSSPQWLDA